MGNVSELGVEECLALIRTQKVGRIGLNTEDGIRIFPVNFVVHDDAIVFRTLAYGAIAASGYGDDVAFEIDELDEEHHGGWSVLAVGPCRRIEDPDEVQRLRELHDPEPWAEGQRRLYFRIQWRQLTGRRVGARTAAARVPESRSAPTPDPAPARSD
jgi:nitroimidazol reductase NimA-like FMN-containing flavoprotein (pyridoxamine 5'-phosphate oxidase superfamily)